MGQRFWGDHLYIWSKSVLLTLYIECRRHWTMHWMTGCPARGPLEVLRRNQMAKTPCTQPTCFWGQPMPRVPSRSAVHPAPAPHAVFTEGEGRRNNVSDA